MDQELFEETIRLELEKQADAFGVNYYELAPSVRAWLRSLVMDQVYSRDSAPVVSAETGEEELD